MLSVTVCLFYDLLCTVLNGQIFDMIIFARQYLISYFTFLLPILVAGAFMGKLYPQPSRCLSM